MEYANTQGGKRWARKEKYKMKFEKMLGEYNNCLMVGIDNVGSLQMQKVRIALRGKAVMIMGKNTMMRMIIKEAAVANPKLEGLLPFVRGNMGLVFTNDDLKKVRNIIVEFKTPAAAKSGTTAPTDVFVPAGPTGMDPGQTGFFQALNIPTKIVKGAVEIISEVHLIKAGDKVTSSAVALLGKLNIQPFFYGIKVFNCYEAGSVYPSHILDITEADLFAKFFNGVSKLTALSLAARVPNALTLPVYLANGFRKLLALSQSTSYKFKEADDFFAKGAAAAKAAPAAAAAAPAAAAGKDAAKGKDAGKGKPAEKPKKEEAPPEEEDDGLGGGLDMFG
jgi:large subunit ribosomal protein LP0